MYLKNHDFFSSTIFSFPYMLLAFYNTFHFEIRVLSNFLISVNMDYPLMYVHLIVGTRKNNSTSIIDGLGPPI